MAAPKLDASTDLGLEKTPGRARTWVLIGVAAVLVLAAGGGAAWYFLARTEPPVAVAGKGKAAAKGKPKAEPSENVDEPEGDGEA